MVYGIDAHVLIVGTLFMAGMIYTFRVAPRPTMPLTDTNVCTTPVAHYISSILIFIITS